MSTPKEIFLELIRPGGQPERQLRQYEALAMYLADPINVFLRGNRKRGSTSRDRWGVTIDFPEDAPGAIPVHSPALTVCPDVTRWREVVHAPDLEANCAQGWEEARAAAHAAAGDDRLVTGFMGTGIFEQCHFLMDFENTLTALYEHPDEMHELIESITQFRLTYARMLIDGLQPDVLFTHDDWGTKNALFMKPEMWREFFKEPYRRFYGYIRSRGVIAIHHADSYLAPIVDDMAEIGIQVWQGVLPENDIPALQRHLRGKLVLMGGLGAAIDRADAQPEEILDYTRRALNAYCPGGHFIPSITYGLAGTVFPHVDQYLDQAIDEYNARLHVPHMDLPPEPRRRLDGAGQAAPPQQAAQEEAPADLLSAIASALEHGQQKKLLSLCRQALDLLKPHMAASGHEPVGSACLGTVQGDMHDIGKNLVKIMMEGSGIQVIDLGVDVSPQQFIDAAQQHHCGIIACSSLLTTTMQGMRQVVELARARGIRDQVKIMVGGAPISQAFCDEIGADAYTPDAGTAARTAVALLRALKHSL